MTVALPLAMLHNYSNPRTTQTKKNTRQMTSVFLWLKRKNLFQTFEQQDEVEIEQEIKEIRELLDEGDD